jgi:hypothetical protein
MLSFRATCWPLLIYILLTKPLKSIHFYMTQVCACILMHSYDAQLINPLTPNGHYSGRTAPLTSRCCILNIYSTNIRTEDFEHAA